ncbi:MAG: acetyl-CoA carboxylase biotin carboxyl carrier protein [Thermincola sp.]|nr:acetyl-CoA carboxylase biotin carboxyl carrier protein [Thermincola sp.]MDT3703645.1 acetyl-CoA carboxylase biotin carboxyl carrier protein [Thermincola sp.]
MVIGHRVEITDTTLRDAHQSLWATRMRTDDMLPIAGKLDEVGYHSLEVWGGATFDVCLRFLNEDPWTRLRLLKKEIKKTPLQMLLRGQSLVGLQHYPDDVVERFTAKSVENGIDIIRIFDALNDIRNLEAPIKFSKKAGAHVQAAVVYTISPVHTMEHYLKTAQELAQMGADSICIKDMAGLLTPYVAYDLVKLFKQNLTIPVQLHSHYIGGLAVGSYLKAADANVDVIDTAAVPLAFGASQPPVETVVRALQESPHDTRLNIHTLFEVSKYFEDLRKERGFERGLTRITDMRVFEHQVPGGMISNLVSQLEEQKALHRMHDVLAEIPRVRDDMGYPPLVTPTSQIVGVQAVLNVLTGQRYKLVPGEVRGYVQGQYGKPPAPIKEEIIQKILGDSDAKLIKCRPADLLEPKMDTLRKEIQDLAASEEDVLAYAIFPQVARKFFEWRQNKGLDTGDAAANPDVIEKPKEAEAALSAPAKTPAMNVSKEAKKVNLSEIKELIKMLDETDICELHLESAGVKVSIKKSAAGGGDMPLSTLAAPDSKKSTAAVAEPEPAAPEYRENLIPIVAPMVGTFYSSPSPDAAAFVSAGQMVTQGQTVCIIEAMKLMNEIEAEISGRIVDVLVENGQPVEYGQTLFLMEKV